MADLQGAGGQRDDDESEYENPIPERLDRDLNAVLQHTDNQLMLVIGIGVVMVYLPDYVSMPPVAASILRAVAVLAMLGGIVFAIVSSVRGKRKVARRYGVACQSCGVRPKVSDIVGTADVGLCPRCGAELPVRQP